jgi:uncharacterized protein (DUF1778 family)
MRQDKETITSKVDSKTRQEIRVAAAKKDMSMSEWIREAAIERLEEESETTKANA